mmetsp:Transcript_30635/g.34849  ORF Transcript_30635/g.34849 Transcript_30635/m.34849 type:complete len:249 (+) Transcript_30635:613-1359(+)
MLVNYKFKTTACRNFEAGFCPLGDRCHFAHNADELRCSNDPLPEHVTLNLKDPNVIAKMPGSAYYRYKTIKCKNYERDGYCKYQSACTFAHGDTELRPQHPMASQIQETVPAAACQMSAHAYLFNQDPYEFYTSLTHNRPADRYTQDNEEPVNPEFFQEAIKQHQAQMMYFEAKSNVSRDHSEDYSNSFSSSMDEYRTAYDYEYRSCGNSSDLVSSRFDSSEEEYSREDFVFETDNWKYGDDSLNTSD